MIFRHSGHGALLYGAVLVLSGVVMVLVGGAQAAATGFVPTQLALALSGGVAGLALLGVGLGLVNAHVTRVVTAEEVHRTERLVEAVAAVVDRDR